MPVSAIQLPLTAPPHNNQQLFSDHYLDEVLPQRAEWQRLTIEAQPVMTRVAEILAAYTPSTIEAQTERDLVRPVLEALGHTFEVMAALKTPDGTKIPDYVFYHELSNLVANRNKTLTDELPKQGGFAVGDAKYWERKLDVTLKGTGGDLFNNKNPSYQIAFYMQHCGVEWGILTNGRLWRLYQRDTAHKLDRYYEVDLPGLIESGDVGRFLYFYAFFRRAAFDQHALGVGELLRASIDYALGVSETLKTQVFESVRHLAQGMLDYAPNGLERDEQTLKAIYDNSLILLYRLLFVLYAEARELLPLRESADYRQSYSLQAMTHEIARNLGAGRKLLPTSALLWPRLRSLFEIIDVGSPPLRVATFNGGLFDPTRHPFLQQYAVGDAHLQQAIDTLARVNGQFVDYRDLAEHHLGSIYEGLLEYQLAAIEPEAGWTVAIVNDRGERKTTGSYYTPYFIVAYIVDQTVGPMLREAVAGATTDAEKIAAVLNTNVLDPAMGSGYFLVEATEYIARFLVDQALTPTSDAGDEADLVYWKRRVVQSCIYGVDLNPLAVDLAKLSLWLSTVAKDQPLSFLDHHLRAGNSLVGTRVAELQAHGTPPTKARGPRKQERVAVEAGQLSLLDDDTFRRNMSIAVDSMWLIEGVAGATIAEVKEQERVYAELRETLTRRYSRLANLVTATQFGLEIDRTLWQPLADYAVGRVLSAPQRMIAWVDEAERIATRERFFHWDLEFPEIFFDRRGEPLGDAAGFDVVIGNPPYVRQERLQSTKPYFRRAYSETYHGVADLYVYFYHLGIRNLKAHGLLGYISSGTFRNLSYGKALRQYLVTNTSPIELIEFEGEQIFANATTYPIILIIENSAPAIEAKINRRSYALLYSQPSQRETLLPQGTDPWIFTDSGLEHVLRGWDGATPLGSMSDGEMYRGVTTGLNEAFVIDRSVRDDLIRLDPQSAEIIKPFVRGEDLHPWYQDSSERWLIFTRRGTDIDVYPAVKDYLQQFRVKLEPRPKDWDDSKRWNGRKSGNYAWFEIQDSVDYFNVFERMRIHSTKISAFPAFSIMEDEMYAANTSYVIPVTSKDGFYLLGLLDSRVCEFFCRKVFTPKAGGYYEVQPAGLMSFPIPSGNIDMRGQIAATARSASAIAQQRGILHTSVARRILSDLGASDRKSSGKLTSWWELTFPAFRAEIQKVFKHDIPLKERDEWETWLTEQRAEHKRLTAAIVALETELNARVYDLFDLSAAEIATIEEVTKYRYGEV